MAITLKIQIAQRLVVHRQRAHLVICGQYLSEGGKVVKISGVNIVKTTG